jgi:GTP pyrophosphokinase
MNVAASAPAVPADPLLRAWLDRQPAAALAAPLRARLQGFDGALSPLAGPVWDVLEPLRADPEVQLAACLHLTPALREATQPALDAAPGLRTLLDGLRAAEQVWSLHAQREARGNAEGLRRLLLAIIRDLRVVLVLLSVQLVRLRNAGGLPEEERRALAQLTADIHAPLANRLGIWQLKWELEDLAFRYLQPETYQRIARLLDEKRGGRERFIEEAKQKLRAALAEVGVRAQVEGRPKHIFSIWKKMQRKGLDFSELYDIRAVRVLVDDVADCYAALGIVHQLWTPIPSEFDDYIAKPKGNDYRSLHTAVVGPEGRTLEVQIRTHAMHEHAELGVAAHWRYKEGGKGEASFERKVAWMRQLLEQREGEADESAHLLSGFSTELIEDRIYLLTPKGEVVDLPQGGTVLDFAYHVHTEVGHRCRGAKVNGRIVPLDFKPASGDRVEIMTSKTAEPRRDWLLASNGFLASGRARDKVRSWFHRLDRARNVQAGREMLDKELRRVAMMQADLAPVLEKFRLADAEELQVALALGDIGPSQVSRALHDHAQAALQSQAPPRTEPLTRALAREKTDARGSRVTVEGVGNLLSQLARCCEPMPGDAIVGYLTRGRGVSIHRRNCGSVQRLLATHPERALPVNWGQGASTRYEAGIQIRAYDRKSLLKDLTNVIAQSDAGILEIGSRVDEARGMADIRLRVRVTDFSQLSQLLARLDTVPGVQDARRLG